MTEESPLLTETPLADDRFSLMERAALALILAAIVLFAGAIIGMDFAPGNALSELVQDNILDPLNQDATQGDAGYNPVDTAIYSLLLVAFVLVLSAWLRKMRVPARDASLIALIPWVFWAAFGEVNEDGEIFAESVGRLFVSPLIHFHVAAWVIVVGFASHRVAHASHLEGRLAITQMSVALVLLQCVFLLPQFLEHWSIGLASPIIWSPLMGLALVIGLHPFLECCTAIEQGLIQVGIGGCFIQLAGWLSMYTEPLDGSTAPLWPMALVMLLPLAICILLWFLGRSAMAELHHMGLTPGLIPEGITLDDWDRQRSSTFERLETLTPRAMLAVPVVLVAMYGQMVDGLATWLGVDQFGYSEKHVLSQKVIELTGAAWGFAALKFALAGLVWWLFASARFEHRHRHLRLLVILCLLVVGLAPGLRDILRLTLAT